MGNKYPNRRKATDQENLHDKVWSLYLDNNSYTRTGLMCDISSAHASMIINQRKGVIFDELWNKRSEPTSLVQHLEDVVGGSIRYSDADANAGTDAIDPTDGSGEGVA